MTRGSNFLNWEPWFCRTFSRRTKRLRPPADCVACTHFIMQTIATFLVIVSISTEQQLRLFEFNPANGALRPTGTLALTGTPGAQCVSPDGKRLYVSVRSANSVAVFNIDAAKKTATPIGTTKIDANAAYVTTDRTGRWLLWASYSDGLVGSHPIGKDGLVQDAAASRIATHRCAHSIQPDAANRFVLVPHTCANAVYQFRFDATTGKLTANDPAKVEPAAGLEPRHLAFHPKLPIVYCDDEKAGSVTAYQYDKATGVVKPFHTASTLPVGFAGKNSCADLHMTTDGRFVYASNRGHDSIAGFAVDEKTGQLTSIGQFATAQTPRSFALTPDNNWVIAAGQDSNTLVIHKRDAKTGKLTRAGEHACGKGPAWVQIIAPAAPIAPQPR